MASAQLNYSMLEYLIQLPCDVLAHSLFGFLEMIDIIEFEKAGASHESQQLLRAILPHCPPIDITGLTGTTVKRFELLNVLNLVY